jgi:hypothetical protein
MGLLAIWMIGGNLLASQLEKEINQELEQKAKELAEAYPDPEPNDSALKLEAILVSEFGMVGVVGSTNGQGIFKFGDYIGYHPDFESSNNEFEQIQEQLSQYIDSQISKPNDEIDPPPQALQRYLESKADALEKVQNHVLNSEVPKLETVTYGLLEGDFSMTIQSYLGMANFQKILALDILEKQRQGKNKEAIEMLEVSWRISQSLQNSPSLIGQLVALIVGRFQAGVIRKVDNLSPEWQERLLEHDYRLSVLKTIEGEYFLIYSSIGNLNNYKYRNEVWTDSEEDKVLKFISQIPLSQPYFRFSAINTYHTSRKSLEKLPTQNICQPQDPKLFPNAAWWNLLGQLSVGSLTSQDLKAAKSMLELEFTQKILQVKELAKKQGKWPESMPNLESLFCPDRQYIYQVSEDGTMTISLDQQPEWVKDRDLSLTYSDRTPPQSQN